MKRNLTPIILIALIALGALWAISGYNALITAEEGVSAQWGNVESQYQRRADLIPNLVSTVKGYAAHESETLQGVVSARARATQVTVDADRLTPEALQQYQAAQGELTQALGRLLVSVEQYPDLKANENFRDLQAQLEGTENRIAVQRQNFNDLVKAYNTKLRTFPKNILASLFGFEAKPYFEAQPEATQAPKVEF